MAFIVPGTPDMSHCPLLSKYEIVFSFTDVMSALSSAEWEVFLGHKDVEDEIGGGVGAVQGK